jgi:hypothetical protein
MVGSMIKIRKSRDKNLHLLYSHKHISIFFHVHWVRGRFLFIFSYSGFPMMYKNKRGQIRISIICRGRIRIKFRVKGWIRVRIKAKNSEDLEAQNRPMEAMDAHNRRMKAQKNGAIEGGRPVLEVSHDFDEDPNPERNRAK